MSVSEITDAHIRRAVTMIGTLDGAVHALQWLAGIKDGGVAAICFSGFDWDEASTEERVRQIKNWLETERHYEQGES